MSENPGINNAFLNASRAETNKTTTNITEHKGGERKTAKGQENSYEKDFLATKKIGSAREQISISSDTKKKIEFALRESFSDVIGISNYVDNILLDHFNKNLELFKTFKEKRENEVNSNSYF